MFHKVKRKYMKMQECGKISMIFKNGDPSTPPTPELEGDVNHDGVVDVADITRVASIILTGKAKEEEDLEEEW